MFVENEPITLPERTEFLHAQEKVAFGDEISPALLAEQVFAQRFTEAKTNDNSFSQGFIP